MISPLNNRIVAIVFAVILIKTGIFQAQIPEPSKSPTLNIQINGSTSTSPCDILNAKKMLSAISGFGSWAQEAVEFNVIEPGAARIAQNDDKDEIRTVYRGDWDKDAAINKPANLFQLKIYHGFDFHNKRVVKYGNQPELTDVRFYQQTRRTGVFAYLRATKMREFDNPPAGISAAQVDGWNDYSFSPKTGAYYVIRSRDGRHYLLHLKKFANQAKAPSYWQLEFEWKEISI